jgi:flavin reductase (DIM6/NTAB) family NADH-FMN oxidoreductase RutF
MTMILEIEPNKISTRDLHKYLLSSIGPRPIALASTIDLKGVNNVSPFSFFNIFSANPPIAIFSPARRVRNNTTKDTLENIKEVKEVVINIVNDEIVEKASISSTEFPREIDEFIESGLTPIASKKIKPFRVYESPVQMECKVNQIIELGNQSCFARLSSARSTILRATGVAGRSCSVFLVECVSLGCCGRITSGGSFGIPGWNFRGGRGTASAEADEMVSSGRRLC